MNEYQITVSLNGQFMFRTDWDDNKERVAAAAVALQTSMVLAKVEIYSKARAMTRVTAEQLFQK